MREAAFTFVSIILLLGNLAAVGTSGRERAKRAVCLANLKQLTSAWHLYADQNDGKIVSATAGFHYVKSGAVTWESSSPDIVERAWIGKTWPDNYANVDVANPDAGELQQKKATREGALWPFVADDRSYKCPVGRRGEWITYAIVDAMNGLNASQGRGPVSTGSNHVTAVGKRVGDTVLWIKKLSEIVTPPSSQRMVFIDEGAATPDSFAVHYDQAVWWDNPPSRHSDGTTVSWADGHSSYLQWKGAETIKFGRTHANFYGGSGFTPQTPESIKDLQDFQQAVWGRLGYE
jgi:prepilin-type processing-associated H-X9-DG protein